MFKFLSANWIHYMGTYLSLACAIECVLTPLIITLFPFLAAWMALDKSLHAYIMLAAMLLSLGGFCWGIHKHRKWELAVPVFSGLLLIAISFIAREPKTEWMAVLGSLFLFLGHMANRHFCRQCARCQSHTKN